MESIYCQKMKTKQPALNRAPFNGELGERILNNISAPAWAEWLIQQTKIINEYKLDPLDPKAVQLLHDEMICFLFGNEYQAV